MLLLMLIPIRIANLDPDPDPNPNMDGSLAVASLAVASLLEWPALPELRGAGATL